MSFVWLFKPWIKCWQKINEPLISNFHNYFINYPASTNFTTLGPILSSIAHTLVSYFIDQSSIVSSQLQTSDRNANSVENLGCHVTSSRWTQRIEKWCSHVIQGSFFHNQNMQPSPLPHCHTSPYFLSFFF